MVNRKWKKESHRNKPDHAVSILLIRWHLKEVHDASTLSSGLGVTNGCVSDFGSSESFLRRIHRVRLRRMWIQRSGQTSVRRIGGCNPGRYRSLSDRAKAKRVAPANFGIRFDYGNGPKTLTSRGE